MKHISHSFEGLSDMYDTILASWGIDMRTVSDISVHEGNLVFMKDGVQWSCPACTYDTYQNIRKHTLEKPWNIKDRVKSVFWRDVARRETHIVIDAISKRSTQTIHKIEDDEEKILELNYIRYLLGIPSIDVMKEIVLPYEINIRAKK